MSVTQCTIMFLSYGQYLSDEHPLAGAMLPGAIWEVLVYLQNHTSCLHYHRVYTVCTQKLHSLLASLRLGYNCVRGHSKWILAPSLQNLQVSVWMKCSCGQASHHLWPCLQRLSLQTFFRELWYASNNIDRTVQVKQPLFYAYLE